MAFFTKNELKKENIYESRLYKSKKYVTSLDKFDVFLSHSYDDREYIPALKDKIENDFGYKVYVDWMEDTQLDRSRVSKETAEHLRKRMKQCQYLFFVTSSSSSNSKWMPWELGYFDGLKSGNAAIMPLLDNENGSFNGQEYLGLYPVVEKASTNKDLKYSDHTFIKRI